MPAALAGGHDSPWTVVSGFGEAAGQLHQAGCFHILICVSVCCMPCLTSQGI